jgi:NADH:ubiquinone oxidoreductase subunit 5 (subunit L)/multisubunit Na+/H+ antiporter MnhA subunit
LLLLFFLFCFFVGGFLFDFHFFSVFGFDVYLTFVFDYLSLGFFSCVSLISGMVFCYRNFYIRGGLDLRRFSYLVFLFVASMFLLVFSGNFFLTMVG